MRFCYFCLIQSIGFWSGGGMARVVASGGGGGEQIIRLYVTKYYIVILKFDNLRSKFCDQQIWKFVTDK